VNPGHADAVAKFDRIFGGEIDPGASRMFARFVAATLRQRGKTELARLDAPDVDAGGEAGPGSAA
jgi:hypothetical protein